ncbi:MAG TPA: KpsF/GutQ family sugar-phosphate isomerase [Planctomycetaceae bacterium]|nr:KpsF/GutQ family sugar-phosphate isomerase [Planctomycetaceae bacterium]
MNQEATCQSIGHRSFEILRLAREIIRLESRALADVAARLDRRFCDAVDCLYHCRGSVIVSGMGKAGLVGQKIMATLASTGTRAHCMHPAEAVHGDLGRVHRDDVVLLLSQSGETEEVTRLLPSLVELGVPIIAITARDDSTLGRAATVTIEMGALEEAGSLGLAPSTSTTVMLAVGDALALVTSQMRDFRREDFARFHPAGTLGLKLSKVQHVMRPLAACRMASDRQTVREVLTCVSKPGRRSGAVMLLDSAGRLSGIFTDSDLARLFEHHHEDQLDVAVREVMTPRPLTVAVGTLVADAVEIIARRKISELPVIDANGCPIGMIDITDIVGMLPRDDESEADAPAGSILDEPRRESAA